MVPALGAGAGTSPVVNNINWTSYLARHDPIWNSGSATCWRGYTELLNTIKHETVCSGTPCTSAAACVEESARQCEACAGCTSFGLCPLWHNGTLPQLFGNKTSYIPNAAWTTWVQGGPLLQNHSGCGSEHRSTAWEDGAWLGNGLQGSILRWSSLRALRLDVGRADIWDRRAPGSQYATGAVMFDRPRLPTGSFFLNTSGDILGGAWRVHLAEGVLRGELNTTAGRITFLLASLVAPREAHVLTWNASGGENGFALAFSPAPGDSTRHTPPPNYVPNPPVSCSGAGAGAADPRVCTQALLACDCGYATAFTVAPYRGGWLAVMHTANDAPAGTSAATARAVVAAQAAALGVPGGLDAALADQATWLASFFTTSFASIPATALEGACVLQTVKLGAATRARGGVAMDLHGPWWQPSGWELYWWDMNVAVTYWPLYTAARFDLAATLTDFVLSNTTQLAANPAGVVDAFGMGGVSSYDLIGPYAVTPGALIGNFPWIMHNLYSHASYSGNATMLRDVVFPLLRGSMNVYRNFSFVSSDGRIHLPASYSPEYPYPRGPTNDTHYDLALFAWGARTLVSLAERFGIADPLLPYWRGVGALLAPYPVGAHGYNVSLGVGFDLAHRHFSHLFAIFPLHNVAWEDADGGSAATRDLMQRSLDRWTGLTCPGAACPNGFTFDGAISISALMGSNASRREDAARFAVNMVHSGLLHKSTMYSEGHQPCLESPLGLASAVQDMLLQSWGGRVRVFPGVPDSWSDAVFHDFAAEGGFRVSAVRAGGATRWVALTAAPADAGGAAVLTVTLAVPKMAPPFSTEPPGVPVEVLPTGDLRVNVTVGETLVVAGAGVAPPFVVQELPGNASEFNFWGDHEGGA